MFGKKRSITLHLPPQPSGGPSLRMPSAHNSIPADAYTPMKRQEGNASTHMEAFLNSGIRPVTGAHRSTFSGKSRARRWATIPPKLSPTMLAPPLIPACVYERKPNAREECENRLILRRRLRPLQVSDWEPNQHANRRLDWVRWRRFATNLPLHARQSCPKTNACHDHILVTTRTEVRRYGYSPDAKTEFTPYFEHPLAHG